jgi:hypothetical protein
MTTIKFETMVGPDRTIRLPAQFELPAGTVEVVVRPSNESCGGRRRPGACKGTITFMSDDFDAPLDDLKEHL